MTKDKYLNFSIDYFKEKISFSELMDRFDKKICLDVEQIPLPKNERVMFITNHPDIKNDFFIPAELIAECKGGNTFNFPFFHFPFLRQMMFYKAMNGRKFKTLAYNIGWTVSMQEMWHLLINPYGCGRTQEIICKMKEEDDCSLVIFPEGGVRNLDIFRTGFFHIACEFNIRHLVLGIFNPVALTLENKNSLRIVSIENMSGLIDSVNDFVFKQRQKLKEALEKVS